MKQTAVLFLGLFFHVLPAAQDLPPEILVDQYLLEATKAIENGETDEALRKFEDIEEIDVEPPAEFLFLYGKFLVENSFPASYENRIFGDFKELLDYLLKGEAFLKQYILSIERGSEHYASALELLSVAAEKADESQRQLRRDEYAAEEAARLPMGEMVSIPGGSFRMGDLSGSGADGELPVHTVTVRPFKLGKYEVTFAQWDACVADGGCDDDDVFDKGWGRGDLPVIHVAWDYVQLFIDWLNDKTGGNYRLPTEAEWEYAARAGSTTWYTWGDDIGWNRANCGYDECGDSYEYTAPVGSFPANAWGLHDMHGNVPEWVQDCWHHTYEGAPNDGSAWTSSCQDDDGGSETFQDENSSRVVRSGSWDNPAWGLRSAFRSGFPRANPLFPFGFRLAQDE